MIYSHINRNLPVENMKLMFKGKLIHSDWPAGIKEKALLLLLASQAVQAPTEKVIFQEDLTEHDLAKAVF
jgi:hypothetical protein